MSTEEKTVTVKPDQGTTCAAFFTRVIFAEGCKLVAAGMNAMDVMRGITMAVDYVLTNLKSRARMISTSEEIAQVGTIFANGDRKIGQLIAKAMEKVGKDGVIFISDGRTLENELEIVKGMKLDRGYVSHYFITNQKTQKCELENPLILIHEKKISSLNALEKVLEIALRLQRSLLIVAEDFESGALATLILNELRAGIKVCAIKAPGFGENRKANLLDLATFSGGVVISEELGMNLENIEPEMFGSCKKTPVRTIASNAGVEGAVVVEKLLEQDNLDLGYDAAKGEYVDMIKSGIIDPLKVIRTALVDAAASVSSLLMTTEAAIVEFPKEAAAEWTSELSKILSNQNGKK